MLEHDRQKGRSRIEPGWTPLSGEITPCNKVRQRITGADFYRSYVTLRSVGH